MKGNIQIIQGNSHTDDRGIIRFINDFDMAEVVRMYSIKPTMGVIRAWQGHLTEKKWFFVVVGRFMVKTVDMHSHERNQFILSDVESTVLEIPGGFYNGFEALTENSTLLVFSNATVEQSKADDYRKSLEQISW